MDIKFCGAARSVTGSCHLVEFEGGRLLVDCGMRQGQDTKTDLGEGGFLFDPSSIDAVLLTHAHIDHSGLIPLLVKRGFSGVVLATEATSQLATIMLPDSAHIQEGDAENTNRKRLRAGKEPIEPLYTLEDANNALKLFRSVGYKETVRLMHNVTVRYRDMGHLLGSAAIELWVEECGKTSKLVFSGDIGRDNRPIIRDPDRIESADYLIIEGTYGDRNHELSTDEAKEAQFSKIISAGIARGGNIVIPSFAVGRTQEILYFIKKLICKGTITGLDKIPVYIDSPLGIEATRIYERCAQGYYDEEAIEMSRGGSPFDFPTLRVARTADESKLINFTQGAKIIISSSGMCDAGRIRHHLKHNLYRHDSTIVFAGYQAVGTLGRMLIDGVQSVKLFGEEIRVNATIEQLTEFSGHAGRDELIKWITDIDRGPDKIFFVHGEETALESLNKAVQSLGYTTIVPALGGVYKLGDAEHDTLMPSAQVEDVNALDRDTEIKAYLNRVLKLLEEIHDRRSPDMELKLDIMEADIKAFADRWQEILMN